MVQTFQFGYFKVHVYLNKITVPYYHVIENLEIIDEIWESNNIPIPSNLVIG